MSSPSRWASVLSIAAGLALIYAATSIGCGPQQKFCPDSGDGVCRAPIEAAPPAEMPEDMGPEGPIYVGADAQGAND